MMTEIAAARRVRERLAAVRERVEAAARRGGRDASAVTIVAVTKGFPAEAVVAAAAARLTAVGENRVQEARDKRPAAALLLAADPALSAPTWHLIGHLQTNKVRAALELFDWIESVDSLALASELSRRLADLGRRLPVLVEIKTAPEPTKHGIAPEAALDLVPRIAALPGLEVAGLMTVGPLAGPARPAFRALRRLAERLPAAIPAAGPGELSMGMSGDFEEAVEEGATILRLGTALFGPRPGG